MRWRSLFDWEREWEWEWVNICVCVCAGVCKAMGPDQRSTICQTTSTWCAPDNILERLFDGDKGKHFPRWLRVWLLVA
ncbi:hypothetical protein BCR41DRAFT_159054 [Lobosporangium transversale]|uniref:Uncharacterized protein n=1 Tax=Lobosporangium transversale TaxID=64571 RepID=A0A1Y2GDJ6_9FUNG|nr:hypothetical protein BCR41DRAFT_159054 [Lobosporangium transversale]ORZ07798.1 hypothetical protein BCR41DRAFT_159054 [Lobosporangium transversale]|eukprot:XP_021878164.1 hypothetical protein BCR41DRAFT_159054 [Lobosporangium transversale]